MIHKIHRKKYKSLPPHSHKAYPLTNLGEANKTLVIAVIAIVAVVLLSFLLFFSNVFVGKAITGIAEPAVDSIGIFLQDNQELTDQPFTLPIMTNLGDKSTTVIKFEMVLPNDVLCPTIENALPWPDDQLVLNIAECHENLIAFEYATINPNLALSGPFKIAGLNFANGISKPGVYTLTFEPTIIDSATHDAIPFAQDHIGSPTIVISSPPDCEGDVDGDGLLDGPADRCDPCPNDKINDADGDGFCASNDGAPCGANARVVLVNTIPDHCECNAQFSNANDLWTDGCEVNLGIPPNNGEQCSNEIDDDEDSLADCFDGDSCNGQDTCTIADGKSLCCWYTNQNGVSKSTFAETFNSSTMCLRADRKYVVTSEVLCEIQSEKLQHPYAGREVPEENRARITALGLKIKAEEWDQRGNVYVTRVTALENITLPFKVFTTLYDHERAIKVFESRNFMELMKDQFVDINTDSLGQEIGKKQVIIWDDFNVSRQTVRLNQPLIASYE